MTKSSAQATNKRPPDFIPTSTLAARITELVQACFSGLYIESHEAYEAIRDLTKLARSESWRLGIWDCDSGLMFHCAEVPVPVNPSELSDPLANPDTRSSSPGTDLRIFED